MFAVVVVVGLAFASCSKNDDNEPAGKENFVMIDGKEHTVVKVKHDFLGEKGNTAVHFMLPNTTPEDLVFSLNKNLHYNKVLDLTKSEKVYDDNFYWTVYYTDKANTTHFWAGGRPAEIYKSWEPPLPTFKSGTLFISVDEKEHMKFVLKNGKVTDPKGKEHTISINWDTDV